MTKTRLSSMLMIWRSKEPGYRQHICPIYICSMISNISTCSQNIVKNVFWNLTMIFQVGLSQHIMNMPSMDFSCFGMGYASREKVGSFEIKVAKITAEYIWKLHWSAIYLRVYYSDRALLPTLKHPSWSIMISGRWIVYWLREITVILAVIRVILGTDFVSSDVIWWNLAGWQLTACKG